MFNTWLINKIQKIVSKTVTLKLELLHNKHKEELRDLVSKIVHAAIEEMFNNPNKSIYVDYGFRMSTIGENFQQRALTRIMKDLDTVCETKAHDQVHGEIFIDKIIERINSKQLV